MTITNYSNDKPVQNYSLWQRMFSKNKVIVVRENRVGSVAWLKQVSEEEYLAFCDYLAEEVKVLFDVDSPISGHYVRGFMEYSIECLMGLYFAPNKRRVSRAISKIDKVMKIVQEYKNRDIDISWNLARKLDDKMNILRQQLEPYSERLVNRSVSIKNTISPLDKWQTPDVKIKALLKNDKYDIEAIEPFNNTGKKILAITESFRTIEIDLLSIEDKYMLQEIQSSYVPNIYTSALSLKDSEGSIIEQTEKDFSTQLDFVENEIKRIKDSLHKRALDTVKAQTTFALERMNEVKAITR